MTNTERQPKALTNWAATKPPSAEPIVKPQNMEVTRNEGLSSGQYSEVRVIALGMAPPSPSPVKKRSTISWGSDEAKADTRHMAPKNNVVKTSTLLRPKRSESGPNTNAPAMSPK